MSPAGPQRPRLSGRRGRPEFSPRQRLAALGGQERTPADRNGPPVGMLTGQMAGQVGDEHPVPSVAAGARPLRYTSEQSCCIGTDDWT
jgi:hypothetical protein